MLTNSKSPATIANVVKSLHSILNKTISCLTLALLLALPFVAIFHDVIGLSYCHIAYILLFFFVFAFFSTLLFFESKENKLLHSIYLVSSILFFFAGFIVFVFQPSVKNSQTIDDQAMVVFACFLNIANCFNALILFGKNAIDYSKEG